MGANKPSSERNGLIILVRKSFDNFVKQVKDEGIDEDGAKDIVQESFIAASKAMKEKVIKNLHGYISGTIKNKTKEFFRARYKSEDKVVDGEIVKVRVPRYQRLDDAIMNGQEKLLPQNGLPVERDILYGNMRGLLPDEKLRKFLDCMRQAYGEVKGVQFLKRAFEIAEESKIVNTKKEAEKLYGKIKEIIRAHSDLLNEIKN